MEFLTILLSALLGIVSPAGLVLDRLATNAVRDRLDSAEQLQVRIDNAPSYQVIQGRVDRVRIAGRGLFPQPGLRIEALEVETDAIAVDAGRLRRGKLKLERPFQAGVRLVLNRQDLNRLLQSEQVTRQLRDLSLDFLGGAQAQQLRRYDFINPQVDFLENNRLRFQVTLQEQGTQQQLPISVESGLGIIAGQRLQLVDPVISINNNPIPSAFTRQLTEGISRRLDLSQLEASGTLVRVLEFKIDPQQLAIAAFVRVNPEALNSGN